MDDAGLRAHVLRLLDWQDAHVGFDAAVAAVPAALYGHRPAGLPYSLWQLLEHVRLTQRDILDFCTNPEYEEPRWPDDYWPASSAVPTDAEWEQSIRGFRTDRDALKRLASDVHLFDTIPHGSGQTYLRELLLVADHNAYHLGEFVVVRRLLGIWSSGRNVSP
jgi:hypothetical protein